MRKVLITVLVVCAGLMVVGVIVFRYSVGLPWLDAIYFVITTMTTVGYGDINLQKSPAAIKLFGNFLMITGAATLAALFGIITDTILHSRLRELLGKGNINMRNHIVLCGLGNVGFRVLEHLIRLGEEVVVVEMNEECRFADDARNMGVPVVTGDIRLLSTLEKADINNARCLIAVSDKDMANLEAVLSARSVNEEIHIVMRIFDHNLANKLRSGFGIETAFSTSALAAPAFAMAAIDPSIIGSFYVGEDLMLNLEITVRDGSRLNGMTTEELEKLGEASILAYESVSIAKREIHPSGSITLNPGDKLFISTVPRFVHKIHELNAA